MDRTERFYRIELLIKRQSGVSFEQLLSELEVSPATLKRDLQYLRDRMDAPIVYARDENVYRFADGGAVAANGGPAVRPGAKTHELPGVWFSEKELHALLTMHQLIAGLDDGGVLGRHLQPLLDKLHGMLGASGDEAQALMRRVRIANPAKRAVASRWFEEAVSAVLSRRRLTISYYTRSKRSESERVLSPQRLLHYRNTWYLDAWCHASGGLRRFALDAVRSAKVLDEPARELPMSEVESALDQGYGIFGGARLRQATLHFSAEAAQW
ncbi:MAG: WYL domain-containing protein, partial [Caulobacter sp.]|nr:WYL domain-containing protein [Vitreoscilla sp.]